MSLRALRTRLPAVLLGVGTLSIGACRNPFVTYTDEYGRLLPEERLRSAGVLDLDDDAVQEPEEPAGPPPPRWRDLFEGSKIVELPLDVSRAWTLENNLDLEVALQDPEIARTSLTEQEARFESFFEAQAEFSDASPSQSVVFPDQFIRPWDADPGVVIPLRTGGTARVSLPLSRGEDFDGAIPVPYAADLQVGITQPLLRGGGRSANTHFIRLAALETQAAQARTKLEVIRQLAAVDRAYWLAYEARRELEVRQEQYEHALDQLNQADARFTGHVGPEIEVVRARAGLSRRIESILFAELAVKDRQRELKRIMNEPGLDVDSTTMLDLVTEPEPVKYDLDAGELIRVALRERAELLELELRLAQDLSSIDFAENERLPLFTLDYTYRVGGRGSSFANSVSNAFDAEVHGWQVGLDVEVPLGNEAAESRVRRAILTRLQRLSTRAAREQEIKQEVLSALDNLHATWERIKAAQLTVDAEERNYVAEQGQYRLGLRNSTEVLDAENRLAEAKVAFYGAVTDYEIAQVDLAFATGLLLTKSRVRW